MYHCKHLRFVVLEFGRKKIFRESPAIDDFHSGILTTIVQRLSGLGDPTSQVRSHVKGPGIGSPGGYSSPACPAPAHSCRT